MAALQYGAAATTSHLDHRRLMSQKINAIKPVLSISCLSTKFPVKPTKRKNHLRQKILKTLKKPITPKLPPANPILPTDPVTEENVTTQEILESENSENSEAVNAEVREFEELSEVEVSVPAGASLDGSVGILPRSSILKYGLWFVGAFVFHTVCAILFFGDNNSEILNGSDKSSAKVVLSGNGNGKMGLEKSGVNSIGYVDELEMERKIEEIRVMAREARKKEMLESRTKGLDGEESEESNGGKHSKSRIGEKVDDRLVKMRKKLENARQKMPVASVGYSREESRRRDGVEKGDMESNGALLFKKKYKFKYMSDNPIEKPKDFTNDTRIKSGNLEKGNVDMDTVGLGDGEKQRELSDVDPRGIDAANLVEEGNKKGLSVTTESARSTRKKVAKERGRSERGKGNGAGESKVIDESRKLNAEAMNLKKSSSPDVTAVPNALSEGNNSLRVKKVGDAKPAMKSGSETDFWWLNLPYVLAILMQRGDDGEGGEGLFTLKSISNTEDLISHMVAFEDRADATNFCYLVQSFFEDLEDFKADVIPLTIKELKEAMKSMRVLVVKRGQLQLYAGQPLTDAEAALRVMIEQA